MRKLVGDSRPRQCASSFEPKRTEREQHAAWLGVMVYFCDSRSPWQRGSNENANGLLRQYFPKGTSVNTYVPDHLQAVEYEINNRPRRILRDRTPTELFTALLTSPDHQLLRR